MPQQIIQRAASLWLTLMLGVIIFTVSNIAVVVTGNTKEQAVIVGTLVMVVFFIIREQHMAPIQKLSPPVGSSATRQRLTAMLKVMQPASLGLRPEWQYGAFGGPNWCVLAPGDVPRQFGVQPACSFTVASEISLALERFQPGVPVSLRLIRPDREVLDYLVKIGPEGRGEWDLVIRPGDPIGEYRVTAVQGALVAGGPVVVQRPVTPRVFVEPRAAPAGSSFTVSLAGFPPNQRVPVFLYRFVSWSPVRTFRFLNAELPPVTVDQYGEAIIDLTTMPDDPEGWYLIHTEPEAQHGPEFEYRTFVLGSVGIKPG